jgi:hypothetical protein
MTKPATQAELRDALRTLRTLIKEVGGNYLAGLQAEVARAEHALAGFDEANRPSRKQLAQMKALCRLLSELDLKPRKGRRRDLKTLDKTIGQLSEAVDNW